MTVKKITSVLLVDEVEPCVKFWKERLGFEVAIEVPEGNTIGFVSPQKAGVELMYQSYASVEKDSSFSAQRVASIRTLSMSLREPGHEDGTKLNDRLKPAAHLGFASTALRSAAPQTRDAVPRGSGCRAIREA
jgi:hypothetical protein